MSKDEVKAKKQRMFFHSDVASLTLALVFQKPHWDEGNSMPMM